MNKIARKESTSDLQSRLKSRKLLGMAETSSGIHVSKVSQVLGNDDRYCDCFTSGLQAPRFMNMALLAPVGFIGIAWPKLFDFLHSRCYTEDNTTTLRLHSAALLGLTYLCWKLLVTPIETVRTVTLKLAIGAQATEAALCVWGLCNDNNGNQLRLLSHGYLVALVAVLASNLYHHMVVSRSPFLCVLRRIRAALPGSDVLHSFVLATDSGNVSLADKKVD